MKHSKINGYILLATLILFQFIALFMVYEFDGIRLSNRTMHGISAREKLIVQADEILRQIEQSILVSLPVCIISEMKPEQLKKQSIAWWQAQSCSGNFNTIEYYYILENLGVDPCVVVSDSKEPGGAYYRITLLTLLRHTKVMLQSVMLISSRNDERCQSELHQAKAGQQSWIIY